VPLLNVVSILTLKLNYKLHFELIQKLIEIGFFSLMIVNNDLMREGLYIQGKFNKQFMFLASVLNLLQPIFIK
jgi:hypothetical protein